VTVVHERKFGKWLAVTNDGRTTIDTVEILRLKGISIESTIFQFKLMSEHALGLCLDLQPFVRGQVDGHIG
jgi:hypothetical protein